MKTTHIVGTRAGAIAVTLIIGGCAGGPSRLGPPATPPVVRPQVTLADAPTGVVGLDDAVAAALGRNPELVALAAEVRARDAERTQAALPPNPELGVELENVGRTGGGGDVERSRTTVGIAQRLELGGQRAKRTELATLDTAVANRDWDVARQDVRARTARAFFATVIAQERAALGERGVTLAQDIAAAVDALVTSGAASPADAAKARVALARARADRDQSTRAVALARRGLAAAWSDTVPAFIEVRGVVALDSPPPLERLDARLPSSPDVARSETRLVRQDAALDLERAARIPDVTVRLAGRRFVDAEANALVAELTVPLPLFDRNAGRILAAEERRGAAAAERDGALLRARIELATAYQELAAARARSEDLQRSVIPDARAALATTRAAFESGRVRSIDVLDAQRTVLELEAERLEAAERYWTARATLERLIGTPLDAAREELPR